VSATLADQHPAAALLAGAKLPHGHHERADEGWDPWQRTHHGDDPDALTRGRHSQPEHRAAAQSAGGSA
jgi:hypothetical protein